MFFFASNTWKRVTYFALSEILLERIKSFSLSEILGKEVNIFLCRKYFVLREILGKE